MSRPDPAATTSLLVADDGWCSTCTVCGLAGNIMLCEFGCANADSVAVCCLAYHPACLGLSKAPKEQFVCPRHGRHSTIPARKLPHKALNCILRCGPKTGGIKTGRPKKFKKEQVDRMVQLLEQGLEMTVPDSAGNLYAGCAAAKLPDPNKNAALEIIDVDGCCVLCGGGGADLLCTFPCSSASSEADTDGFGTVSVCGCMFHSRCAHIGNDAQPVSASVACLQPFTCPLHPSPCDPSSEKRWSHKAVKWALAFDPVSSLHLLFGARGLTTMYQGWNSHCALCMRGDSVGDRLLKCKAGLPPLDQLLVKRISDESVESIINAEMGLSCVCPSAFHLRCLVNRAKSHCNVDVNPFNFICPLHPNASICIQ